MYSNAAEPLTCEREYTLEKAKKVGRQSLKKTGRGGEKAIF